MQVIQAVAQTATADVCINWAAARHSASELASALALHQFSRSITSPMALAQSQPQDEYQRLMNTNASKRAQCQVFLNIAEREH